MDPPTPRARHPDPAASLLLFEWISTVGTEVELSGPVVRSQIASNRFCVPEPERRHFDCLMRALYFAFALLSSSLVWAGALLTAGRVATDSVALIATTLVVLTAISVVGMLVGHARWALRLGLVLVIAHLSVAVLVDVTAWWWVGLTLSAVATAGLAGPGMKGVVRDLPAAAGPPPEAVVVPLLLLAAPAAIAVSRLDGVGWWDLMAAAVAWVSALAYSKAWPAGLFGTRFVAPVSLLVSGMASLPAGLATIALAVAVLRYAWTANARLAVKPLVEAGTRVPIPPELTPSEILDQAGYDSRGRRTDPR